MSTITDPWLDEHRVDTAALADAPLIGIDHVEAEVASLVARLADPAQAARLGAEIPRSILLHGPAGIGKTHTARSLARRLGGLPAYEVGADELTAPVVRALFAALGVRHARSVLVIDEIDLVGGQRADADAGSSRTLAALLTALDGLQTASGVLVVAASSQPSWALDPALVRAGRLGFVIEIGAPDEPTRRALLAHFLADRPTTLEVDLGPLAAMSEGVTPADLRAACVDAAGIALAAGNDAIAQADLVAAFERAGRVLPAIRELRPVDAAALRRVCVHEAGHVLVGSVLRGVASLHEVVIGDQSGSVSSGSTPDGETLDEAVAGDAITTLLGGFAAERVILGGATLAHRSDVVAATDIARRVVGGGLDPSVPPLDLRAGWIRGTRVADRAADAVAALLAAGREQAAAIVDRGAGAIAAIADRLQDEALPRLVADPHRRPVTLDIERLRIDVAAIVPAADAAGRSSGGGAVRKGQAAAPLDLVPTATTRATAGRNGSPAPTTSGAAR